MGWKDWPRWLKYGVVIDLFFLIPWFIMHIPIIAIIGSIVFVLLSYIFAIPLYALGGLTSSGSIPLFIQSMFSTYNLVRHSSFIGLNITNKGIIIGLIIWFIIGAGIGQLYGKIKSRKNN